MKYLKNFEHNNKLIFKQYVVVYISTIDQYYIFRTLSCSTESTIYYDRYYYIDCYKNFITMDFIGHDYIENLDILYQEDNEEDAITDFNILLQLKKYNL